MYILRRRDEQHVDVAQVQVLFEQHRVPWLKDALAAQLQQRFDEAKWRGEVLHKRTLAEYLLYVADRPAEALQVARDNWQSQREWPDRQLLLAAERASGEQP